MSALNHSIDSMKPIQWSNKYSVCVIMASKGYPDKFKTGYVYMDWIKQKKTISWYFMLEQN